MRGAAAQPPAPSSLRARPGAESHSTLHHHSRVERSSPSSPLTRHTQAAATFTHRPPRGYHCALEANGARWPSRSSKSAVSCYAGGLGSTPRRFRQRPFGAQAESLGLRQAGIAFGSPNRLNSQTLLHAPSGPRRKVRDLGRRASPSARPTGSTPRRFPTPNGDPIAQKTARDPKGRAPTRQGGIRSAHRV
jgi:hypothetical protein